MRRALLRSLFWSVAGGLPPRRPDQVDPSSSAGVAPGSSSRVTRARLVIISGPSSGMFLYSGTPGSGDLVESVTEASVDPYGNLAHPGFTSYDNVFGGIAQLHGAILNLFAGVNLAVTLSPSGQSVFNTHGALIFNVNVAKDAWFLYADTGSATQGALIASSASAAGTDQFGNAFQAGVVAYGSPGGLASVAQLLNGLLQAGTPGQIAGSGGAAPGQLGLITGVPGVVRVDSGLTATGDADAFVDVRSKNGQASISGTAQRNVSLAGPLALSSEGSTPAQLAVAALWTDGAGFPRAHTGDPNDANVYAIARKLFVSTAAAPGQLINSVAAVPVTGITGISVTAGVYLVRGMIQVLQGGLGPGNQALQFTGPAITRMTVAFESVEGATIFGSGVATALNTNMAIGAPPVNTTAEFHFDGIIRFSAAGTTFGLAAICVTSGTDQWTLGTDSYLELSPL